MVDGRTDKIIYISAAADKNQTINDTSLNPCIKHYIPSEMIRSGFRLYPTKNVHLSVCCSHVYVKQIFNQMFGDVVLKVRLQLYIPYVMISFELQPDTMENVHLSVCQMSVELVLSKLLKIRYCIYLLNTLETTPLMI